MTCVLTPSQARDFATLKRRTLLPAKFIDDILLHATRLFDGVITLLQRGGLGDFVGKIADVYLRLTYEFFLPLSGTARQGRTHTIMSHLMLLTIHIV